jgi:hypothetical protein
MQKILALARRGVGGEKETAEAMLAKLLAKYGLTVADLENESQPVEKRWFSYQTEADKKLLIQIVASVTEQSAVRYSTYRGQRKIGFTLTALQFADVDVRYTAFRAALRKELEKATARVYAAFVYANDLGVARDDDDDGQRLGMDMEELAAIMALMRTMKPTPVHRQLAGSAT